MYYFSEDGKTTQFDNLKDFCMTYVQFVRDKFNPNTQINLCKLIEYLKNNFQMIDTRSELKDEDRLAALLSEKEGSAEDIVNFILLILFPYKNIRATKFSLLLANRDAVEGTIGSSTNPICHFGVCFKSDDATTNKELYIDINKVFDKLANIEMYTNDELRKFYNKDFYFSIVSKIYDYSAQNFDDYYNQIVSNLQTAKPKSKV